MHIHKYPLYVTKLCLPLTHCQCGPIHSIGSGVRKW